MATYASTVRRGLPRQPGGDPWPPAGSAPEGADDAPGQISAQDSAVADAVAGASASNGAPKSNGAPTAAAPATDPGDVAAATAVAATAVADGAAAVAAPAAAVGSGTRPMRRGLPRTRGGEPWPPAGSALAQPSPVHAEAPAQRTQVTDEALVTAAAPQTATTTTAATDVAASEAPAASVAAEAAAGDRALRRGLPRARGGEPWPPAGFAPVQPSPVLAGGALPRAEATDDRSAGAVSEPALPDRAASPAEVAAAVAVIPAQAVATPLPFTPTVFPGRAAAVFERERLAGTVLTAPEPRRYGPFTRLQWAGAAIVGGGGLLVAAAMAVLAVRFLLSLPPFQDFLAAYPGEYPLPEGAPVGIPPWLGWQHFFNVFLIVLIIRTGLGVRTEKRPNVFWSPRTNPKRKISLTLWFHQSLDILWIVNGVIYVVLLFATGQWMKIVPTSWEVFPNAASAALQYVSLDWPTENGWINYNSLQQLAYFATVFLAAPLAIATGVRMSGIWPKNATALSRAYPIEWARAIHFPVMLYFVAFIFVHVALVLATGALRNLNHIYASQDAVNWVGFWIFVASLAVIAVAWVAARPLVLAPIARLFGTVSGR